MRKTIFVLWIICLLILTLFFVDYRHNKTFIKKYNGRNYTEQNSGICGVLQPYVKNYNNGNVLYKKKNYSEAEKLYTEALNKNPSHKHNVNCDIRYNKALTMLQQILEELDESDVSNKDEVIVRLNEIINLLIEEGCADNNNTGHNKDCQELKNYIDQLIKSINNGSGSGDSENKESQNEPSDSGNKEDKLKERQNKGQKSRTAVITDDEGDVNDFFFDGETW